MSSPVRPSSRATTARRSLRGERRPLSRAVGTGEFCAARDQRTSVPSEPCLPLCNGRASSSDIQYGSRAQPASLRRLTRPSPRGRECGSPAPIPTLRPRPATRASAIRSQDRRRLRSSATAVVASCNSRRGAFRPKLIEGEPKDCRRDESQSGEPTDECGNPEQAVPIAEASGDQQRSASSHESDGEHIHRAKCPARRAVCVPAADSVPPIAVFAKDVTRPTASLGRRASRA